MDAIDILIKYWGHTHFRSKQEEIINQVISKKDTLALLPTGGGKSICYQIPALIEKGICLVISPLISLMDDQVRHLTSKGIKSVAITSNMQYSDIDTALTNCIYGNIKFLYLSPEKLKNNLVQSRIKNMNINIIAVDEAHCISEWGHNFRPAYRNISEIRNIIPNTPILALTATATIEVINDIQKTLLFKKHNVIRSSFARDNLSYIVDNVKDKKLRLVKILTKIKSSVIVYVGTRKATKQIADFLIANNFSTTYYHAGLPINTRTKRQEEWTKNQTRIIVATNAFGMGIDKPDVKLVVHMDLPSTIERYFQEAGRAGRNEKSAYAFLLANNNDIEKQKKLLELKYPKTQEIISCYQNIANYAQIGVGDLPEDPITFNITQFSKRYNTSILKTYNILKYLEKEEEIKLSETMHSPSMIMIIISSTELYKFQIVNKYYDAFIKFLLRSYSNLFNNYVIINENKIASHLNTNINDVKSLLRKLHKIEVIKYKEENNASQLIYLKARKEAQQLKINQEKLKNRKIYETSKLNKITEYITKKSTCRHEILLDYFGEKTSEKCGICDVCIIEKRNTIKDERFKKTSISIKSLIYKNELSLEEICKKINNVNEKEIINILNFLFDNDKIQKFGNKYQWKE